MSAVTFDTLRFFERLKAAGVSEQHALAMAEAQKEAFSDALAGSFATKSDIARVEADLTDIKAEQKIMRWMLGFLLAGMAALLIKAFA
ncbi:MAG: hypothetical protein C1943_04175 [Halochromatium sp.]|nr:hypothetical protein [Halochromatium sp.]